MALFSTFCINPGSPVEPECGSRIAPKKPSYDRAEPGCRGRPDCIDRIRDDCRQYDPAAVRDRHLRLLLDQCAGDPQYPHFRPRVDEQCAFDRCDGLVITDDADDL